MRYVAALAAASILVASCEAAWAQQPDMELQSGPLTPGIVLPELGTPIHQVRLIVSYRGNGPGTGRLVLDPNVPEFDEFGLHVGGLDTPYVKRKGGPLRPLELDCEVAFVKEAGDVEERGGHWFLYRLSGPKLTSTLHVATRNPLLDSGPARLVVNEGGRVTMVVDLNRFGLVLP